MASGRSELTKECDHKLSLAQAKANEWCRIFNIDKNINNNLTPLTEGSLYVTDKDRCTNASKEVIKIIEECQAQLFKNK